MIDWNHPDYHCKEDGIFHDYSRQLSDGKWGKIVEQCVKCGHIIEFAVAPDGRIDNSRYVNTHALDFLQEDDPIFTKYYQKRSKPYISPIARASLGDKKEHFAMELAKGMKELRKQSHFATNLK